MFVIIMIDLKIIYQNDGFCELLYELESDTSELLWIVKELVEIIKP